MIASFNSKPVAVGSNQSTNRCEDTPGDVSPLVTQSRRSPQKGVLTHPKNIRREGLQQAVLLHFVAQGVAADAQRARRLGLVVAGLGQRIRDEAFLVFVESALVGRRRDRR